MEPSKGQLGTCKQLHDHTGTKLHKFYGNGLCPDWQPLPADPEVPTPKFDEWINEDELPEGYPYDEMFQHSKLGPDGLGGVRIFPKLASAPPESQPRPELPRCEICHSADLLQRGVDVGTLGKDFWRCMACGGIMRAAPRVPVQPPADYAKNGVAYNASKKCFEAWKDGKLVGECAADTPDDKRAEWLRHLFDLWSGTRPSPELPPADEAPDEPSKPLNEESTRVINSILAAKGEYYREPEEAELGRDDTPAPKFRSGQTVAFKSDLRHIRKIIAYGNEFFYTIDSVGDEFPESYFVEAGASPSPAPPAQPTPEESK